MKTLRFLGALLQCNIKQASALRVSSAVQIIFMLLNNLTFFVFWIVVYSNVKTVRGAGIEEVAFIYSVAMTSYGIGLLLCGGVNHLSDQVAAGALEVYLTQPKNAHLRILCTKLAISAWGDVASGILFLLFAVGISPYALMIWALSVVAGGVITVASLSIFQSIIFWIPRSERLSDLLNQMYLSFTLYPNSVFSGPIRAITFTLIPAAFLSYMPLYALKTHALWVIGISILAAGGYFFLAQRVFALGLKRYESGSGFVEFR